MSSNISSARNRLQDHGNLESSPIVSDQENSTISEAHQDNEDIDEDYDSDATEVFPNTTSQTQVHHTVPNTSWQQELAASRVGRDSRASSIFSTRTPLTVQSDDARSINIEAGSQTFRISRDGSHITNTTGAPPPYPGPPLEDLAEDSGEEDGSSFYASNTSTGMIHHASQGLTGSPNLPSYNLPLRTHVPIEHGENSPENRQTGFNIPQILRSAIQSRWYSSSVSPVTVRRSNADSDYPQLRNDLRRTHSESSTMPRLQTTQSYSAWPVDSEQEEAMSSPFLEAERQMRDLNWDHAPVSLDDQDASTAEISQYYNRIMRDMDREHRRRLHERDSELARLRELLNEKDVVYRQQLRERDHVIDGLNDKVNYRDTTINELKKNAYNLENDMQLRLEKARNETEEMWEKRWEEYRAFLLEKLGPSRSRKISIVRRNNDKDVNGAEASPDDDATQ